MTQPPPPSPQERQDDENEREHHGIPQGDWDAAFAWVEGEYVEIKPPGAAEPAQSNDHSFAVWPCNWETVNVFLACSTRWRITPRGSFELDYAGVDMVLNRSKLADADRTFAEIQAMEDQALKVLHGHG
ncbi:MAG: DUF1799 domain-containing protein [Hylemonella sp.]|uniref:DUF1799 domain-containing protein n=1 Tax=Hylemonella sp. TaxID=2066020 RepID=UPI00391DB2D7